MPFICFYHDAGFFYVFFCRDSCCIINTHDDNTVSHGKIRLSAAAFLGKLPNATFAPEKTYRPRIFLLWRFRSKDGEPPPTQFINETQEGMRRGIADKLQAP